MAMDKNFLAKEVTKKLTSSYTLENEFVGDVENLLVEVFSHYYVYKAPTGKKARKVKKPKSDKPSVRTDYNQFVSMMMPTVKDITPKERMKKIGAMWKTLDQSTTCTVQADGI